MGRGRELASPKRVVRRRGVSCECVCASESEGELKVPELYTRSSDWGYEGTQAHADAARVRARERTSLRVRVGVSRGVELGARGGIQRARYSSFVWASRTVMC